MISDPLANGYSSHALVHRLSHVLVPRVAHALITVHINCDYTLTYQMILTMVIDLLISLCYIYFFGNVSYYIYILL